MPTLHIKEVKTFRHEDFGLEDEEYESKLERKTKIEESKSNVDSGAHDK